MKLNKKGFTLIELLAVIVVTSLVLGLSSYGILKTYNKSKETVIVLNEASILEAARIQSSEANSDDNSKWRAFGDTSEVFCTTIQRLKNAGLLKKEATSEEHGDDAIITVERNNTTFNVTNTSFLDDDDTSLLDLCNIKFYTIHYEYNVSGESDTVPKDQKREVSQPTNLSSYVPQRKGYLFVGWNSEPNGTGIGNYSAGAEFAYDSESTITLYAQWQLNTYTINYYLGNNTSTKGATLIGTSKCTPSDKKCSLTRWESLQAATPYSDKGWTFAGWSTNKDSTNVNYIDGYTKSFSNTKGSIIKLYAIFTRNVKFYSGENSATVKEEKQYYNPYYLNSSYYTSVTIPSGASISTWTYMGYTTVNNIAGSSSDLSAQGKSLYTTSIRRSPTYEPKLYAIYQRTLTLKFNKNNGSGTVSNITQKQYYNTGNVITTAAFTLPENGFTRSGYTFSGWNTKADGTGTTYAVGSIYSWKPSVTSTSITKTLYARWTKNCSIIFNSNSNGNATGTMQPIDYQTGNTVTLSSNNFAWTGHTFKNWNTKADGTGTTYANGASITPSSCGITLYAQWQDNTYTITFNQNGASSIGALSKTCIKGVACDLPSITRTGYEIIGWGTSSDSKTALEEPYSYTTNNKYTGNSNITLYAITKKKFTINYISNDSRLNIKDVTLENARFEIQGGEIIVNQTCSGTSSSRSCYCYIYNNETSCHIYTPEINEETSWNNGYYYSINENETRPYSSSNSGISYAGAPGGLSSNRTLYVAYKKVSVTFKPNGAKLDGGTSDITKSCIASLGYSGQTSSWNNEHTKCSVTSPTVTRTGYDEFGYNTTPGATSIIYNSGSSITLNDDSTYYAIALDKTPPTFNNFQLLNGTAVVDSTNYSNYASDSLKWISFAPYTKWFVSDSGSGINTSATVYWNASGNETLNENLIESGTITGTQSGNEYIFYDSDNYAQGYRKVKITVCDNAGNCSNDIKYFKCAPKSRYVTWCNGLNCYSDKNKSSVVTDSGFEYGAYVTGLMKTGNWYYKGEYGCYLDGDYLDTSQYNSCSSGGSNPTPTPSSGSYGTCRCPNGIGDCVPNSTHVVYSCDAGICFYKGKNGGSAESCE